MAIPGTAASVMPSLFRFHQHYAVIEAMVTSHKGPPPVVRAWTAGLVSARSTLATVLTTSLSGPRSVIDVQLLVKPLVDIVQRYPDAGAPLLSRTFEALADADVLFEPGTDCVNVSEAIDAVASVAAYCHFQSTEQDADDSICFASLEVLHRCVTCSAGINITSGTLTVIFDNFAWLALDPHGSSLIRLHAFRVLEKLYTHVFQRLKFLAEADSQSSTPSPAPSPGSRLEPYDTHTLKLLLQKITNLVKKSEDVGSVALGLRMVNIALLSAGSGLLVPHPVCYAMLALLKSDICSQLLTLIMSAKTLEDLCDALPLCASLWSTCGITVAPQFELILYAMRAKYLDGATNPAVRSQLLSSLLSFSSGVGPSPHGPLPFLHFAFVVFDCNPSTTSVVEMLCQTALDVIAVVCKAASTTGKAPQPPPLEFQHAVAFVRGLFGVSTHVPTSSSHLYDTKWLYDSAAAEFNAKPKLGIAVLARSGEFVSAVTPARIAHFLRFSRHLDKTLIGQFLGEEANEAVRVEYCKLFEFRDVPILTCLRNFLQAFQLPKEAQQIDRVIQSFSQEVSDKCAEREYFSTPDVAYLLSVSLVMLNTSLHNPSVNPKARMSLDGFLITNENYGPDVNKGVSLPLSLLTELYTDIASQPIRPPIAAHVTPDTLFASSFDKSMLVDVVARAEASLQPTNGGLACVSYSESQQSIAATMHELLWHTRTTAEFELLNAAPAKHSVTADSIKENLIILAGDAPSFGVDVLVAKCADLFQRRIDASSAMAGNLSTKEKAIVKGKLLRRLAKQESTQLALSFPLLLAREYSALLSPVSWSWILRMLTSLSQLQLLDVWPADIVPTLEDIKSFNDAETAKWRANQRRNAGLTTPSTSAPPSPVERRTSLFGWLLGTDSGPRETKPVKPTNDAGVSFVVDVPQPLLQPLQSSLEASSAVQEALRVTPTEYQSFQTQASEIVTAAQASFAEIVTDSHFLEPDSLRMLTLALLALAFPESATLAVNDVPAPWQIVQRGLVWRAPSHAEVVAASVTESDRACFAHLTIVDLCFRNRDRLAVVLDTMLPTITSWLQSTHGMTLRAHVVVSGLFRLCEQLLYRGHKFPVRSLLSPLLPVLGGPLCDPLQLHLVSGVKLLLQPAVAILLQSSDCWLILIQFLSSSVRNTYSAKCALAIIQDLVTVGLQRSDSSVVFDVLPVAILTPLCQSLGVDSDTDPRGENGKTALSIAAALLRHFAHRIPSSDGDRSSAPSITSHSDVLLTDVALQLPTLSSSNSSVDVSPLLAQSIHDIPTWAAKWSLVVSVIKAGCGSPSTTVRMIALTTLQSSFQTIPVDVLPAQSWCVLLEDVLLACVCQVVQGVLGDEAAAPDASFTSSRPQSDTVLNDSLADEDSARPASESEGFALIRQDGVSPDSSFDTEAGPQPPKLAPIAVSSTSGLLTDRDAELLTLCASVISNVALSVLPVLAASPACSEQFSELWLMILYVFRRLCVASGDESFTSTLTDALRCVVMVVQQSGALTGPVWQETLRIVRPLCTSIDWDDPVAAGEVM